MSYPLLWAPVFLLEAEAIQNGSGFGFNGYDENGKPRWDLVQNVVIRHVEVKSYFIIDIFKHVQLNLLYLFVGHILFHNQKV